MMDYGLLVPPHVPLADAERLGVGYEVAAATYEDVAGDLGGRVQAIHAAFNSPEGGRLNPACPERAVRAEALALWREGLEVAVKAGASLVVVHAAPQHWEGVPDVGRYELLLDGLRRLGDSAAGHDIRIVVENNRRYWGETPDDADPRDVDLDALDVYFATFPEDWIQLAADVDHESVRLCLDTSHATTVAHEKPAGAERESRLSDYLAQPDAITHIHWSGNHLSTPEGRLDSHLGVGEGDLPREFHARIAELPATKTFEHPGMDRVAASVRYLREELRSRC
ncbi:MAG: sugar phosphate isomerase/epimerase [Armatimonadota bacterium]|jgi:sugar phosphate isomerase/epimerase